MRLRWRAAAARRLWLPSARGAAWQGRAHALFFLRAISAVEQALATFRQAVCGNDFSFTIDVCSPLLR
jgi:hypothetical protein